MLYYADVDGVLRALRVGSFETVAPTQTPSGGPSMMPSSAPTPSRAPSAKPSGAPPVFIPTDNTVPVPVAVPTNVEPPTTPERPSVFDNIENPDRGSPDDDKDMLPILLGAICGGLALIVAAVAIVLRRKRGGSAAPKKYGGEAVARSVKDIESGKPGMDEGLVATPPSKKHRSRSASLQNQTPVTALDSIAETPADFDEETLSEGEPAAGGEFGVELELDDTSLKSKERPSRKNLMGSFASAVSKKEPEPPAVVSSWNNNLKEDEVDDMNSVFSGSRASGIQTVKSQDEDSVMLTEDQTAEPGKIVPRPVSPSLSDMMSVDESLYLEGSTVATFDAKTTTSSHPDDESKYSVPGAHYVARALGFQKAKPATSDVSPKTQEMANVASEPVPPKPEPELEPVPQSPTPSYSSNRSVPSRSEKKTAENLDGKKAAEVLDATPQRKTTPVARTPLPKEAETVSEFRRASPAHMGASVRRPRAGLFTRSGTGHVTPPKSKSYTTALSEEPGSPEIETTLAEVRTGRSKRGGFLGNRKEEQSVEVPPENQDAWNSFLSELAKVEDEFFNPSRQAKQTTSPKQQAKKQSWKRSTSPPPPPPPPKPSQWSQKHAGRGRSPPPPPPPEESRAKKRAEDVDSTGEFRQRLL